MTTEHVPPEVAALLDGVRPSPNGSKSSSSWAPVSMRDVLAGAFDDDAPTLVRRTDGVALVYPGRVATVSGEPESLKGWLAVHGCAQELADGHTVAYFDFEDSAPSLANRLRAVGVDDEAIAERFLYVRPEEPLTSAAAQADLDAICARYPTLAIVDGVTEALGIHGLDLLDNQDVVKFFDLLPRRIARDSGAGVLLLDHVTKDREARGRFAIGAQAKLAGVDLAYTLEPKRPFGREREGLSILSVSKDRAGHVRQHERGKSIAELHLRSYPDGGVIAELRPPVEATDSAGHFRPTGLMEAISRQLEDGPALAKREIRGAVRGSSETKDLALRLLVAEGFVVVEPEGRALLHRAERPFRQRPVAEHHEDGTNQ
jgi:hypothetical protein